MRIAFTRRKDATYIDGVNRFVYTLAAGLERLGHEVFIVSHTAEDREAAARVFGPKAREVIALAKKHRGWLGMALDWWLKGGRLLRRLGAEAAVVNGVIPLRFKPKVAVNHGVFKVGLIGKFAAPLYRQYNEVVCVSHKLVRELEALGIRCSEIIPIPIEVARYRARPLEERERLILHVGTRPVKRADISIEAVKELRRRGHNVRLVVAGPPNPQLPRLEHVEYKFGELAELYSRALALILPSEYEALPYVALEAQASGTPVVVSDAVPEEAVVNGVTGIVVRSRDPRAYADALERLMTDEGLWRRMSAAALEHAKKYDVEAVARRWDELLSRF
ncbi:glycosyltransferase family 4 protein [Infirmifilum lucidum]|uniref:Glycosyltransferase family 4 protein n=1 Tax=Infirmifilum lucidum TaxID=2776706 RepID=A0A7L9FK75_9CREN|nr:glycosyltransferase family 4 protein [Infirmifilum lucidum]QOJ79276.1 glycosyltransferase family 4 protein [Infirmifilum lucidum]